MATSKTLTPTNVTISIPAMADRPDASVFSNCVDKEADAINAIQTDIDSMVPSKLTRHNGAVGATITIPNSGRHLFILTGASTARFAMIMSNTASNGNTGFVEIYKGSDVTLTADTNTIVYRVGGNTGTNISVVDFAMQGAVATSAAIAPT